jgi:hypothetical protein
MLTLTLIVLVHQHMSYLFHPSKLLARSDLFLLTDTSVTTSGAAIRSKIASMSFEELGWRSEWGEEGLETLLRRLSSFEGRVSTEEKIHAWNLILTSLPEEILSTQELHLMIGTTPFLSCNFCSSAKDYMIYSIGDQLWQFSTSLVLFGLLTARFDSLQIFDEVVFSTLQLLTRKDMRPATTTPLRPHGYIYRTPLLYLLGLFVLAQTAVYLGFVDISFSQGRWDHVSTLFNMLVNVE